MVDPKAERIANSKHTKDNKSTFAVTCEPPKRQLRLDSTHLIYHKDFSSISQTIDWLKLGDVGKPPALHMEKYLPRRDMSAA